MLSLTVFVSLTPWIWCQEGDLSYKTLR